MTDKFSLLAQIASDWWWEMDAELRFTFISEQFTDVFGLPPSAILGKSCSDLRQTDHAKPAWRDYLDDLDHRRPFRHFETSVVDAEGVSRPLWISGKPVFSSEGIFTGYIGVGHDLTELRHRDRKVAEYASNLESILENIEQGVVLFDRDMRVVAYNRRLREFLQLDESFDARGMSLDQVLHYLADRGEYAPEEKQAAIDLRKRLMTSREPFTNERERQDGQIVSVHFAPSADGGGVMTYSDVTLARRQEAMRQALTDQLDRERKSLLAAQSVASVGSWENNLREKRVQWSAETFRIFEVEPDAFSPTHDGFLAMVHPDDRAAVDSAMKTSLGKSEVCTIEHRILTPLGKLKFVVERWQVFVDGDGRLLRAVGTCQDCTELKLAQLKVEESTNLLRVAERAARLGGWVIDIERGLLEWSSVTAEIHDEPPGFSPPFDKGLRYYPPEDRKTIQDALDLCILEGKPFDETLRIITAKERSVWVRVIGEAVRDHDGSIRSIRGAFQDITELLEARESSKRLAEQLYQTLDNITDGFITIDEDWHFTFVNQEAMRLLERSDSDLQGRSLWEMFPDIVGSGFERHYREAVAKQEMATFVEYYPSLGKWFSVRAYPSSEGLAIYLQDVSDSRAQQEHLALLEAAVSRSNDIFLITEADLLDEPGPRIVYVNDAITKSTGYSRQELEGRTPRIFQGPETSRTELARIRAALEKGSPVRAELINYTKDGSRYWAETVIAPVVDDRGHATHFVSVQRDITERKAAQDALAISEVRFRTVAQLSADIVWDWDLAANTLWRSEDVDLYFKTEDTPDSPQSWVDRIHPEDRKRALADFNAALRGAGDDWTAEYRLQRLDGSYSQMNTRTAVIRNDIGKAVRIVGSAVDVTDQRLLEERVRHSQESYRTLFEAAPYAVLVKERYSLRFIAVNDAAVKQYGWSREEMLAMTMSELYAAEDLPIAASHRYSFSTANTSVLKNLRHLRKDGASIEVEMAVRHIEYDGKPATLAIVTDVSERVRGERARAAAEEQLRASQRLDVVGKLTGGVAHDFNNILMVIMANVDAVLEAEGVAAETRQNIERIGGAAERATQLTRQLLAFSRKQTLRPQKTNLNDLVVATGSLLRRTLGEHIEINSLLAEDLREIDADRGQVEAAIINLCINSRDAMPGGGRLSIKTKNVTLDEDYAKLNPEAKPGDYVALSVTDTGTGMTPEVLSKAFEPFFTTKEVGKGTGLGLSMVYGFVKQSKGHVTIYSELGHGTVVTLYLPRGNQQDREKAVIQDIHIPRGTERILVVEDEEQVRAIVAGQLSNLGYRVVEASNGEAALGKLGAGPAFDLLLTDVIMPGIINGKALASEAAKMCPDMRVLFMSGYSDDAISTLGILNPGVSLLTKPFRKVDLAIAVRHAIEGTQQS